MKKSINAWSVDKTTDIAGTFSELKAAGFDAVELNLDAPGRYANSLTMDTTDEELIKIRELAKETGIEISSVSSSMYGKKMGDEANHEELDKIMFHHIHCAKMLGTDSILVVPGADILNGADISDAYKYSFKFLNDRKARIETEGVYVCLENVWNGFFTSPFDMAGFIDRLDSPFIRAYYDVGNTIAFSDSVSWIKILGERIMRIHVKGFKRKTSLNSGGTWVNLIDADINWQDVLSALKGAGYDSYFTAEVSPVSEYEKIQDFYKDVAMQEASILN